LLYGVGKGSENKPAFVCVEYKQNPESDRYTCLLGKGVTFDTGGLNLKPTRFIESMYVDKGGASAVFGAFQSLVELKVKKNLLLVVGLAENSVSSTS